MGKKVWLSRVVDTLIFPCTPRLSYARVFALFLFHNATMQRSKLQRRQKALDQQLITDIGSGDIAAARNTVQLQVILGA